jgi:hypothetical protein
MTIKDESGTTTPRQRRRRRGSLEIEQIPTKNKYTTEKTFNEDKKLIMRREHIVRSCPCLPYKLSRETFKADHVCIAWRRSFPASPPLPPNESLVLQLGRMERKSRFPKETVAGAFEGNSPTQSVGESSAIISGTLGRGQKT